LICAASASKKIKAEKQKRLQWERFKNMYSILLK
jgi:hypothetical protein